MHRADVVFVHVCASVPAPSSEEEMYVNVMRYVDRIFAAVRPRRLLFLAIDGIAPRAKMNQQRVRRFRSAQEARERQEAKEETRRYGMRARVIGCATIPVEWLGRWLCASNACAGRPVPRAESSWARVTI